MRHLAPPPRGVAWGGLQADPREESPKSPRHWRAPSRQYRCRKPSAVFPARLPFNGGEAWNVAKVNVPGAWLCGGYWGGSHANLTKVGSGPSTDYPLWRHDQQRGTFSPALVFRS